MVCVSECGKSLAEASTNSFGPELSQLHAGKDSCCDGGHSTGEKANKGRCCSDMETDCSTFTEVVHRDDQCPIRHEPTKGDGCKSTNSLGAGSCQGISFSEPSKPEREDGCCNPEDNEGDHGCRPPDISSIGCQDGCCSGLTNNTQGIAGSKIRDIDVDDKCCAPKSTDPRYQKNYPSTPESSNSKPTKAPSCCKDKASPCCDVSCLDRIALRECKYQKSAAGDGAAAKSKE